MHSVFIDGSAGTTGLRIAERIAQQKDITVLTLPDAQRKEPAARKQMLQQADIAFLCLPDAAAREAVALAEGSAVKLIDASTAHRTTAGWAYGFPELTPSQRSQIANSARVAVPGCHASGYIALVRPLVDAGALEPTALFSCTSLTGYSGGGKPMIAEYTATGREAQLDAPRHYATAQAHKHLPEMQYYGGLQAPPVFNPVVADYYAGMLVSIPLHMAMLRGVETLKDLHGIYAAHYAGQALVHVLPAQAENAFLSANAFAGRDDMELLITGNDERATLYARYDNLGKGASGAAIQCMNILLGREETTGLVYQ